MHFCSLLLSTCLIGQASTGPAPLVIVHPPTTLPARIPAQPIQAAAQPIYNAEQINNAPAPKIAPPAKPASTAEQLVSEASDMPSDGAIAGQPMSLLTALVTVQGRPRQLEVVHAYWRLVQAVGNFRYCLERQQRLGPLKAAGDEAADLRTAQKIAIARLHEAAIDATSAQHDLAAVLHLVATVPLPLPADRPLTEPYRTRLAELYSGQKPPDAVRMLDQTLPLRQRAVESHAAAVLAAEELLDAAIELQASGQARLSGVLQAMDAQVREQQAFLASVCRYNADIADYSLAVIPPQTSLDALVSTLIKQPLPARWYQLVANQL